MSAHLTISATDFKAKCLDIFTRLSDHRLERVTVTRRGKPVAELTPPASEEDRAFHGFMKGTVNLPPDFDLTEPIVDTMPSTADGILHR